MSATTAGPVADTNGTAAENETQAVDVVLVFDRSLSMDQTRYELAKEMETFDDRIDTEGKDVGYALLTYGSEPELQQPSTADFETFNEALEFGTSGSVENASTALLAATDEFRADSERVVILVSNEDDDGTAAQRQDAAEAMSSVEFLAVSPDDPIDSSCEFHSPPCDDDSDNELRTMATDVGGDWIDVDSEASTIVSTMAETVGAEDSSTGGGGADDSPTRSYSTSSPDIDPVNGSVNCSTVEIGERFAASIVLENDGTADGTADEELRTEDETIATLDVDVPEDETATATVNRSFDEPGTYDLFYDLMHVGTVEVTPLRDTGVSLSAPSETRVEASVTDARENKTVRIPVTHPDVNASAFGPMTAVWVTTNHDADFTVSIEAPADAPNGTSPFTEHVRPLAYPTVNTSLEESDVRAFGVEFNDTDERIEFYGQVNNSSWTAYDGSAVDPDTAGARTTNGTFNASVNDVETGVQYDVLSTTDESATGPTTNETTTTTNETTTTTNETTTTTNETATTTTNETATTTTDDGVETGNETVTDNETTVQNGTTVETTTVVDSATVSANESATAVTFDATVDDTPRYVASVPANATTFVFGVQEPGFVVDAISLDRESVVAGELVVATVTVDNDGLVAGTHEVSLLANGDPVADTTVYVSPNESRDVSLSFVPDSPGEYAFAVGDATGPTLSVEAPAETEPSETTTTSDGLETALAVPGFTALALLIAMVTVALLVRIRDW
ncbi:MAG: vWA domain-containing protein [archaeon]